MAALADTNVLVYRFDPRDERKQRIATELLRRGLVDGSLRLPHQTLVEFVAAVTRPLDGGQPLLTVVEAVEEVEGLLLSFEVLYPDAGVVRAALQATASYGLSWFDAHMLAYAERFGAETLFSEDFQHGRRYGRVQAIDPFA